MSIIYQQTRRSIDAAFTYRLEFCKVLMLIKHMYSVDHK